MTTRQNPRRRAPGRPPKARGDQRGRLLDVALELFARQGIAATPLSAIARRARVTPAMLHYYFGNREQLLDALVDERFIPLMMTLRARLDRPDLAPAQQVSVFVQHLLEVLLANEWFPPLWLREVLSEGGLLRERLLSRIAGAIAPRVGAAVAAAQANGTLNRDLDPRLTVVSLIGLTVFLVAAKPIWSRIFDATDLEPADIARHTLALLHRGLEIPDELRTV